MTNSKILLTAVAAAALVGAGSASATVTLLENTGWQYGQDNSKNHAQVNSPIVFTADAGGDLFSFTDGFKAGDVYNIIVSVGPFSLTTPTTFSLYPTPFPNNFGPAAGFFKGPWLNSSYSHFQAFFSPGTYSVVIKDMSAVGYPAGFGFRLDDVVPEPSSWALMLMGVGGLGGMLRSRRKAVAA